MQPAWISVQRILPKECTINFYHFSCVFLIILEEQGLSVSSEEVSRIAEEVIEDAYEKDGLLQKIFP